jgi:hypothetical protein
VTRTCFFFSKLELVNAEEGADEADGDAELGKFGHVLSNPLIFSHFCKASKFAHTEKTRHMEATQTLPHYEEGIMLHELGNLLQTFRITPHLISNAQAGRTFKLVLRNYHESLVNAKQEESGEDVLTALEGRSLMQKLNRGSMQAHGLPYKWYLQGMSALAARPNILKHFLYKDVM